MSLLKALAAAVLAAISLAACGSITKPPEGRGHVDDPRLSAGRFQCMVAHELPAVEVGTTGIQVGQLPAGPTIQFMATPGAATAAQIEDQEQGAEVIGAALLYPNQGSDGEVKVIENCLAQGVSG